MKNQLPFLKASKRTLLMALSFVFLSATSHAQNVGVNTSTPHASAVLDVTSTTQGILVPRMTTTQRNAISSPANGLMVYDTNLSSFYFYNGTAWSAVGASSSANTGLGTLKDANGVTIGKLLSIGTTTNQVLTPTGYILNINWDGTFPHQQIFYMNAGCTGTIYLNSSSSAVSYRYQKFLVYEGKTGNFHTASNPDANGMCANTTPITPAHIWNSSAGVFSCMTYGSSTGGFLLTPITRATAGIPATITPPFTIQ